MATIGPASKGYTKIRKLCNAGMDVARLNFSHGEHKDHSERIAEIRRYHESLGYPIAILQDLAGPKIRTGDFYKERVNVSKGATFTFTTKKCVGDERQVYVSYKNLPRDVSKGTIILVDDGKKQFEVVKTTAIKVECKVINGGELKGRRGVNVPGAYLKINSITSKDRKDIVFGVKEGVDFVALSFVRNASDIKKLRAILDKEGSHARIIAKIETSEAVENIAEIIDETDGVMVARGDLALEVEASRVPLIQKDIIRRCNIKGKPVITATQMLESMIHTPIATRAEVNDVANAILDGTDGVMLSEETALGKYPVESVETMFNIAKTIESECNKGKYVLAHVQDGSVKDTVESVSSSAFQIAQTIGAKAIVALTESGLTGRMVSRFKPPQPILVVSPHVETVRQMSLSFGCYPISLKLSGDFEKRRNSIRKKVLQLKIAEKGDKIVLTAGIPSGKVGSTNTIFVLDI